MKKFCIILSFVVLIIILACLFSNRNSQQANLVVDLYSEMLPRISPIFTNEQIQLPENAKKLLHDNYKLFSPNNFAKKTFPSEKLENLAKNGVGLRSLVKSNKSENYMYSNHITRLQGVFVAVHTYEEKTTVTLVSVYCGNSAEGVLCNLLYLGDMGDNKYSVGDLVYFYGIPIGYFSPGVANLPDMYFFIVANIGS